MTAVRPTASAPSTAGRLVAFGDSIAFGYDPRIQDRAAKNYVAYSDVVGKDLGLTVDNFAQPGETTGSLQDVHARNNGGWIPDPAHPGQMIHDRPLHQSYSVDQLDAGIADLKQHPDTKLVTLTIGGNDLLLLQKDSAHSKLPVWASELLGMPKTLWNVYQNLSHALHQMRDAYKGPIVVTNQYELNYQDPIGALGIGVMDWVIKKAVEGVNQPGAPAAVADVNDTFKEKVDATPGANGSSGVAGLLISHPHDGQLYDIHPSQEGRELIAHTIEDTERKMGVLSGDAQVRWN